MVADLDGGAFIRSLSYSRSQQRLLEEGNLREGRVLHLAEIVVCLDLAEHEPSVVHDALGTDDGTIAGDATEGFDGVYVDLHEDVNITSGLIVFWLSV